MLEIENIKKCTHRGHYISITYLDQILSAISQCISQQLILTCLSMLCISCSSVSYKLVMWLHYNQPTSVSTDCVRLQTWHHILHKEWSGPNQRGFMNRWWYCCFWTPSETLDGQRSSSGIENLFEITLSRRPAKVTDNWRPQHTMQLSDVYSCSRRQCVRTICFCHLPWLPGYVEGQCSLGTEDADFSSEVVHGSIFW